MTVRPTGTVRGLATYQLTGARSVWPERAGSSPPGGGGARPTPAPPVLLVHGGMDRGRGFGRVARHLDDLDVRTYDRRGYAASAALAPTTDLEVQVDDLLAVLGDRPSVIVGHSFGGLLALTAAQRRPGVVLAVGAFESPRPWTRRGPRGTPGGEAVRVGLAEGPRAAGEAFMRMVVGDDVWGRLPERVQEQRRAEGAALMADVQSSQRPDPPYRDDGFACPVVVGRGTASTPSLAAAADDLAASVPGSVLVVVEGADHGAHLSHPRGFAEFVRRVVDEVRRVPG